MSEFKSGFVAMLGRTNVGKSTHFREIFIKSRLEFCENPIKRKIIVVVYMCMSSYQSPT